MILFIDGIDRFQFSTVINSETIYATITQYTCYYIHKYAYLCNVYIIVSNGFMDLPPLL